MELRSLQIANFRNITEMELVLPAGLVVIAGENAQGKSNLLEAVYLLALSKSYRASTDRELVSWATVESGGYAMVSGMVTRRRGEVEIRVGLECLVGQGVDAKVRKRVRINGVGRRASDLLGLLNAVFFSADDVELVFGSPSVRRRYLDVMLAQVSRAYVRALQRYQKVLLQRNYLLRNIRDGRAKEAELGYWDESLCQEGGTVLEIRYQAMERLMGLVQENFKRLVGGGPEIDVEYVATAPAGQGEDGHRFQQALMKALQRSKRQEQMLAQTVVGPHRDDLRLVLDGVEMSRHASRGQAQLAALALRLAEGAYLSERSGDPPVLLLDDVLSELDERRRSLVLEAVEAYPQVLVTTADEKDVSEAHLDGAHRLRMVEGRIGVAVDDVAFASGA